jgi:hypothetical protein
MKKQTVVLLGLLCLIGLAGAMVSTNYDLGWHAIGGGGGPMSSANYQLDGTVGQITGVSESTNYRIEGGYWYGIAAPPTDTQAPAAITDLATANLTSSTIQLSWTAPGDDGNTGTATAYDIRYRVGVPITEANWGSATQMTGEPDPQAAGSSETFTVTGLSASTTYYFAIKTADEVPNWSPISNSPGGTTTALPDTTAPAAITNLATSNPTSSSIQLSWTAPGDDGNTGTATSYDIRYTVGATITEANWATATQVIGEKPVPQVAGSSESFTVTGLTPNTTYYFAIKTADEVPNWSPISNSPSGTTLEKHIFDTDASATPYPTISGTHNGTISPSRTLTITELYTYPCLGTGGHIKYAKIWNSSWEGAEANWNGYIGDWHNLSFNNSFTLYANETYNYTIRTGSYPQIIHEQSYNATGGVITCTEFIDINGKRQEGWIPAIKLY